jgi:hypothetical protein
MAISAAASHWVWPLLAASMPWRAAFALLSRVARSDTVRFEAESAAWAQAAALGGTRLPEAFGDVDEATWRRAWRLVQLVDHTDLFLARTRGHRWLDRHFDVHGAWPLGGAFLALTFHWGAGLWALRDLGRSGHRARFLSRRLSDAEFAGDPWRRRYMMLRVDATEQATRAPLISTGGATAKITASLARGTPIVALCDVPLPTSRTKIDAPFRGRRLVMPRGLIALACERGIPIVHFSAGLDRMTGRRRLDIEPIERFSEPAAMAAALARRLEELLVRDPAAWHMWPYASELVQ